MRHGEAFVAIMSLDGISRLTTELFVLALLSVVAGPAFAQEALLETFPIKSIDLNVAIRDQTFAPHNREIGIQADWSSSKIKP